MKFLVATLVPTPEVTVALSEEKEWPCCKR